MLEQGYWIAGIVAAVVTVIGLFISRKSSVQNKQSAKVSGQHNAVNQSSEIQTGERKDSE